MNDNDMVLRQKIEKREKIDTFLAYMLIVILLACIGLVVFLKLNNKDEETLQPEEYVPTYIGIGEISNSLNSSNLFNNYTTDGVTITSRVNGNSIVVNYAKEDAILDINIPLVSNELVVTMKEDNTDVITDVYKEIANIICVYYGNEDKYCRNTLDNMSEEGNDGIRIVKDGNNSVVYINTTKSYTINTEIVYNDMNIVSIDKTDYTLEMLDVKVNNINVLTNESDIVFTGNVEKLNDSEDNFSILVKLYDENDNVLKENKYESSELDENSTFEVKFAFDDVLKLDNINKYSIEIIK